MTFSIESPLPGRSFGCTVRGLTLANLDEPDTQAELRRRYIVDGILVFRDSKVTDAFHLALSRLFGELAIHPLAAQIGVPGMPELIRLRYEREEETVYDVDGRQLGAYVPWHFDGVFVQRINRGGVLRLALKPESGGATGFMDGIDAWDRLPQGLRERVEGREAIYQLDSHYPFLPRNRIRIVTQGAKRDDIMRRRDAGEFPPVVHPMVITQAETGRKVLHFSPMYAQGVVGMTEEEGRDLLLAIAEHITDEANAYFHDWETTDELVLWDNWRFLHKASGVAPSATRAVVRTTISGDYGLGRLAHP